jgi:CHAT domain-containing protein
MSATRADVDSLIGAATALYARGAYDSASRVYRDVLEAATTLGDSATVARTLTSLGTAAWRLGDYPESRRLGERALTIKHRLGLRADLFRSYNALGLLARDVGRTDDALAMFDSALSIARERDDRLDIAKAVSNTALTHVDLGQLDLARAGFLAARPAAQRVPDTITEWNAVVGLASVENRLANPLGAIAEIDELRRRHPRPEHPVGEENAYGQLGTAYDLLGETQRAIAAFDSALHIADAAGLRVQKAEDLKLLAEIYERTGDRRRALRLLDEAFALDSAVGAPDEIADVWFRRASILGALGDASRARASAERALIIHRHLEARLDILSDLLLDAELAARAGDRSGAQNRLVSATRLADTLRLSIARRSVAVSMARIADLAGDGRRVLWIVDSAKLATTSTGVLEWEFDALAARAHRRLGHTALAIERGRNAVEGIERTRRSLGASALRTALISDRADVYSDLVLALLEGGQPAEALAVADRSRSRALVDHLTSARVAASDSSAAGMAERARLLSRIDALVRQLMSADGGKIRERSAVLAVESAAAAELAQHQREFDELLVRSPAMGRAGLTGDEGLDLAALQSALHDDEALLEYYVTARRTYAFVVRRGRLVMTSTAMTHDDLASRVRLARDLVSSASISDRDGEGSSVAVMRALYDSLVSPAVASGVLAGVHRLIIVPHGALAYLPFAALRMPSGRYLVEEFSLLYLPMAAALPALRRETLRSAHPARPIVAFAPFPGALTSSAREAERAASIGAGSVALTGSAATEDAVRTALRDGSVVHVASHGVLEAGSPMFSRIELSRGAHGTADDGRLEVHELLSMRVASPLVFLSGCETGFGVAWSSRYASVSDHATLEQAVLYAGALTVIATRWRVEDASAAAVAERFYAHLSAADAADALALAQRDLIRSPRFHEPHFWAAYAVSGAGTFSLRVSSRDTRRHAAGQPPTGATIFARVSVSLTS